MPALKNLKRERFCREYMKDFNGTQAAIRAGYSKKTANEQAAQLLAILSVKARVAELTEKYWESMHMGIAELKAREAAIVRFDMRKLFDKDGNSIPIHQIDDITAMAIASVEIEERAVKDPDDEGSDLMVLTRTKKFKANDRHQAMNSLARMANLYEKDQNAARSDLELLAPFLKAAAEREGTGSFLTGKTEPKP